ncbi:ribonuclease [Leifsonia xyli subsp. cynodontis DSM 46306]|uniref:HRDC domain-containing protein n=1 Tax=Leifsonia xyli subsp. cynodontis DSM 46306 TaxID=1389489 RepID=U3P5Z1_LEIXC|nr:HRDC domain-containing protein [Leifsonia xyli]AGW41221.1 ribonuclease [Leifsonia xyli subsp. cynodontis DSM 46306]
MAEHSVIDTRAGYLSTVEAIAAGDGPVAVDAERASGFRYSQRAYLIQVFRRGSGTFLFDPPAIGRFDELNAAIAGDEWVLHAATQDLTCLREVGLDPVTIFDTELAARLLGMPRVGLGTVVEELLGIHLTKEHSAADWSTRPLPGPWLEYAALDVELLPDLRDAVAVLLDAADKTEIARQEFADELTRELTTVRSEPWRRLSGIHSIRGLRNLAAARELWLSRDALARQLDIAPGRLVPDASLTAVAKALPENKRALAALREFTGRASRTELDRWWAAVEAGRATDDLPTLRTGGDSLPPPRAWADRNPEADARLKGARAELATLAEERSLPLENLLTPDTLRRVAWAPPVPVTSESIAAALASHGARPWQIAATSPMIARTFVESAQHEREGPETLS